MYLYLMIEQLSVMTQVEIREETGKSKRYIYIYIYTWILYDSEFPRLFQFKYSGPSLDLMHLFELIKHTYISYGRTKFIPVPEYHVYMIYTHLCVYVYME